jgi:hypothetical protein
LFVHVHSWSSRTFRLMTNKLLRGAYYEHWCHLKLGSYLLCAASMLNSKRSMNPWYPSCAV